MEDRIKHRAEHRAEHGADRLVWQLIPEAREGGWCGG